MIALAIPQLAGAIGGIFTASSVQTWYKTQEKSSLNPPDWLFGPVWTILFILVGIALYLVWTWENINKKMAIWIFGIQLALNILWSVLFFGFQNPALAFAEIIVFWIAIIFNVVAFWKIKEVAGILLIPYLLWVSFATFLNYSVWQLN